MALQLGGGTPAAAAPACRLGAYLADLYAFDAPRQTVDADIWFWSVCPDKDLEPIQRFEYINTSSSRITDRFSLQVGNQYWTYAKIVGTWRAHLDMAEYPFDRHTVDFVVEATQDTAKIVFSADRAGATYNRGIRLSGFAIDGYRVFVRRNRYPTTFGDPALPTGAGAAYDQFVVRVHIARTDVIGFIKETWPIYVSFLVAMITFLISADDETALLGARLGMLGAALFTIVVNMRATIQSLGTGAGMSLVDQVHAFALFYVLLGVASTTYTWRLSLRPGAAARALRINRWVGLAATLLYVAATLTAITVALVG